MARMPQPRSRTLETDNSLVSANIAKMHITVALLLVSGMKRMSFFFFQIFFSGILLLGMQGCFLSLKIEWKINAAKSSCRTSWLYHYKNFGFCRRLHPTMNWSPQRSLGSCDHSITKSLDWNLFRNLWLDLNKNKLCFKVYFATYNKVSVLRLQSNTYLLTSGLREMNIAQIIYFTFHNIRQSFQRNSCFVWLSLSKSTNRL